MKKEFSLQEKRDYIFILKALSCLFGNRSTIETENVDMQNVFKISRDSHIANMVSYGINKAGIKLTGDVASAFEYNRKYMLMKDASQFVAQKKLIDAFESNGIANLPVKGQFIKNTYGQPDFRTMSDMDIHIKISDFNKIQEVLKALDFNVSLVTQNLILASQPPFVNLELHGDNGEFKDTTFGDNLFNVASLIEGKSYSYEFSLENHYIYIIEHYAKHFRDVSGMGVRMVCDVYNLYRTYKDKIDFEYVNDILKKSGTYKFHKMLIEKSKIYFESTLNEDSFDALDIFILSNKIFGTREILIHNSNKKFSDTYLENSQKENYLIHRIFPPRKKMANYYPILNKAKFLLPFTWLHRGAKLMLSKNSKAYRQNIKDYKKYNDKEVYDYLKDIMKQAGF